MLVERKLVDCRGIVVVADFVVLELLPGASQLSDDEDVVVVVADDQALYKHKIK